MCFVSCTDIKYTRRKQTLKGRQRIKKNIMDENDALSEYNKNKNKNQFTSTK